MNRRRVCTAGSATAFLAACFVAAALAGCAQPSPEPLAPVRVGAASGERLLAPGFAPGGGAPAKVWVVEAADFDCGYCARATALVSRLQMDYPTVLRYEFRPFPLGNRDRGRALATLAMAAHAEGAFQAVHDAIFLGGGAMSPEALLARASEFGLQPDAWKAAADGPVATATVDHFADSLEAMGVKGTPTFFVNGLRLQGSLPYWVIKTVVDEQIVKFDRAVEAGATPADAMTQLIAEQSANPSLFADGVQ